MATKYLRGVGGNWTDDAIWSLSSGGVNDTTKPTAADDVILDSNSGLITIDSGAVCRSCDTTSGTGSYAGTITHTAGVTWTIGDGTAGAGNVALKFNSGITYTLGNVTTSAISFVSTSATVQTITVAGKILGNITFNGAGGSWKCADAHVTGHSNFQTITLTAGTLDTNNQTMDWGLFSSSNSNTRTLTLGSSAITITGTGVSAWNMATASGMTLTAGTSTITLNGAGSGFRNGEDSNGKTFNNIIFSGSGTAVISGSQSSPTYAANITRTGTAAKTDGFQVNDNFTVSNTITLNGNSTTNRLLVTTGSVLTAVSKTITAATVSCSNVDFRNIIGAGAGSWDLSAITGLSGDCGGNSGITFTTPATQTYTGATGNWTTTARWTSRIPLPQDDVSLSGLTNGQTVFCDMPRAGKSIDATGPTSGTFSITSGDLPSGCTIYGSLTMNANLTSTISAAFTFEGRGAFTVTSAGKSFASTVTFQNVGGTYTFLDAFSKTSGSSFSHLIGGIDSNGFSVTSVTNYLSSGTLTRSLTMGSSLWNFPSNGASVPWNVSGTGHTQSSGTSTILFGDTSASSKTFAGNGFTYYDFKIGGGGAGAIIITGANTFNRIYTDGAGTKSIVLPGATTTTILQGNGLGNGTNLITFTASAGSATVSKASGVVSWNYVNLTNIPSTGGATFYAGANSTDGGGNTGWIFANAPQGGNLTLMGV